MVEVSGCSGGGLALRPFGHLCHFMLEPLQAAFEAAVASTTSEIRIDLAEVTLLSSSAVEFLEAAASECASRGVQFAVVNADGLNRSVLEILGAVHLAGSPLTPA